MDTLTYWNRHGTTKDFTDPFYIDKVLSVPPEGQVIEYGCGYGRLLNILNQKGYTTSIGFDFSEAMVAKGSARYPALDLRVLDMSECVPLPECSVDLAVMSTVLCCNPVRQDQVRIIDELVRVLKPGAVLYLIDYLLTDTPEFGAKYGRGRAEEEDWGVYRTSEGHLVRHHSTEWMTSLLADLELEWWLSEWHETMNGNPARMFHCIARRAPAKEPLSRHIRREAWEHIH